MINDIYVLQSLGSTGGAKCRSGNGFMDCCDVTNVSFDLPTNFIFGATRSAQGNTHNAALLAFTDVTVSDKMELNIVERSLSIGSTLPTQQSPPDLRGILMLWFAIASKTFSSS